MNVVDSSGWVEYFTKGPNGLLFGVPIRDTANLMVPTICVYEVFKRVFVMRGEEPALQVAGVMAQGHEVALTRDLAIAAAQISLKHKLAMADSLILATARAYEATLWTQDEHFSGLPDVRYIEKRP